MISNTNKLRKTSGFTIVELLIVIVVIGILAAITIVAYNGVQARANSTKVDTLAKEVADKAEVYAADNDGTYPTLAQIDAATGVGALSTGAIAATQLTSLVAADTGKIWYCATASGYTVAAYDYVTKLQAVAAKHRKGGTGPTTGCL